MYYFITGEKVQWKLFFIIMFVRNKCTGGWAVGNAKKQANRAPKWIDKPTQSADLYQSTELTANLLNKNEAFNQSNSKKYLRCMKMIYSHEQRKRTRKQICSLFFFFTFFLSRILFYLFYAKMFLMLCESIQSLQICWENKAKRKSIEYMYIRWIKWKCVS